MGLCRKIHIEKKLFELKKENAQWWGITESSHRVTKFISMDVAAMEWLASAVGACGVYVGSSDFIKLEGRGIKCWWFKDVTIVMVGLCLCRSLDKKECVASSLFQKGQRARGGGGLKDC